MSHPAATSSPVPLFGVDYMGHRELIRVFPTLLEAAAYCEPIEWSEAYCAVAVVEGIEFVYDEDGSWFMI